MRSEDTLREINELTAAMVELSLSNEQNFPSTHGKKNASFEITVKNAGALTVALRNVSYSDIYNSLSEAGCFNMKLLDGALVCLRYRFEDGNGVGVVYWHNPKSRIPYGYIPGFRQALPLFPSFLMQQAQFVLPGQIAACPGR